MSPPITDADSYQKECRVNNLPLPTVAADL